jgi:hypothetical protein
MTPLHDYYGLLDLILHNDDYGRFELDGVRCEIDRRDGHAVFIAATSEFAIALLFPYWFTGDVPRSLVQIATKGDLLELFAWLPITAGNKRAIVKQLPIDDDSKALVFLRV